MRKIILIIFITLIFNNVAYSNTDCSQLKKLSKDYLGCITKRTKEKTSNLWDASSGVFLYANNFYLGYSINNLLESSFLKELGDGLQGNNRYKHYYFTGAYKFQIIDKDWHIEPSFLIRKLQDLKEQYTITTRIIYLGDYWSSISVRTNKTIAFGIGLRLKNTLHFGYSYDHNLQSAITPLNYGTHEVSINFHLPSVLNQRHTSFWNY